ncbi:MAG TPA: protein kinase, partial [Gemmatimonadaceae bacterium]
MADALASAHASGIVHRDIKPDNVLLTGHHALVTDFGVAKALAGAVPEDAAESSRALPTTSRFTSLGVALGTPAYMSPEQAAADPMIDHRSDIYSLGVLAYEMLTGCPPFTGMQPQQLLAAHLSQTPEPISAHRPSVPPELESLVMRCLEKHAADRWQSAAELQSQLEAMATPGGGMAPAAASVPRRSPARDQLLLRLGVGVAVVAGLLVVARMWLARPAPAWVIGATVQITNTPGLELDAAVSPDGRLVAYAAGPIGSTRIFVRQVGGGEPRLLTQSVGGAQRTPRWSPDGQTITFLVGQSLYAAPALGGTARMVWNAGDYEFASPVLSPDGQRVAWAEQSAIHVASVSGGERRKLADAHYPSFLVWSPDGRHLAYVSDNAWFIYGLANLGNLSPSSIWIVSVSGGRPVRVTETASLNTSPLWSPDGRSLFFISSLGGGRDVYAQALSSRRRPRGAPVRLTTGLTAHSITFNADGSRLAYSVLTTRSNLWWAPITPARATPFSAARAVANENQT